MAYHLMIFNQSTAIEPTIDIYSGSTHTLHLYWEAASFDIGLPTISAITERADSEAGFCLSGPRLLPLKRSWSCFTNTEIHHAKTTNYRLRILN